MIKTFFVAAYYIITSYIASAETVNGFVFSDLNKNNKKDKGEKGIEGIPVSNGQDVVLTDKEGKYTLPISKNSVVFVIKPSNYSVSLNEKYISQDYYLYYPEGSVKLKNKGVSPTGNLPKSVDFPLYPTSEPDSFKVLFFGDPQPYSREEVKYFEEDIINELLGAKEYSFVAVLGDIVGDKPELYPTITYAISKLNIPAYFIQGNHDMNYDVIDDSLASETFIANFGPKNYAFNYGKVHFVALDDIIYSGDTITRKYKEGFNQEAIQFLKNDLQYVPKENMVVLMMHAPFLGDDLNSPVINLKKVMEILNPFPHTFSISGHNHTVSQQIIENLYGWTVHKPHHHFNTGATCGDWFRGLNDSAGIPDATMRDGSPNGYSIAEFNGNTYTVSYKAARMPANYQMSVYCPEVVQQNSGWGNWSTSEIYVNFFTGSPKDTVRMRIDKGNWIQLKYTVEPDPNICDQRSIWDHSPVLLNGKRPSNPDNCYHLWKSSLPSWLNIGEHSVEIEATDLFNRKFTEKLSYKILD